MSDSSRPTTRVLAACGALLVLALLVLANCVVFDKLFGSSYLSFWLNQGSLIGLSSTLVALVWRELDEQRPNLVSANPLIYTGTCLTIAAGIFSAIENSLPRRYWSISLTTIRYFVPSRYDEFVATILYFIVMLLAFVWLLTIAPTMYFITLITGAPARLARQVSSPEVGLQISTQQADGSVKRELFVIMFGNRPVSTTAGLTAIVLWLIKVAVLHAT